MIFFSGLPVTGVRESQFLLNFTGFDSQPGFFFMLTLQYGTKFGIISVRIKNGRIFNYIVGPEMESMFLVFDQIFYHLFPFSLLGIYPGNIVICPKLLFIPRKILSFTGYYFEYFHLKVRTGN